MSLRYMRLLLFYDLPSVTNAEKKIYRKFNKFLEKNGFIRMQESVYTKLALNNSIAKATVDRIRANVPTKGLIQILVVTEKQFASIECVCGTYKTNHIDSEKRVIIL